MADLVPAPRDDADRPGHAAAAAEATGRSREEIRAAHLATIPAGRYGTAAELASLIAYLASEPARYQTGTFTAVDGGMLSGLP